MLRLPGGETPEIGFSPAARVVALSGLGSATDRRRTEQAGFADHLVKPVGDLALVSAVLASLKK